MATRAIRSTQRSRPFRRCRSNGVRWSTPVDESAVTEPIYIHYGSPIVTAANMVLVPVRASGGGYCLDARRSSDGTLLWETMTDYVNAPSNAGWVPSFSPRSHRPARPTTADLAWRSRGEVRGLTA